MKTRTHLQLATVGILCLLIGAACLRPEAGTFSKVSDWWVRCGLWNDKQVHAKDKGAAITVLAEDVANVGSGDTTYSRVFETNPDQSLRWQFEPNRLYISNMLLFAFSQWANFIPDPMNNPIFYLTRPGSSRPYPALNKRIGFRIQYTIDKIPQSWSVYQDREYFVAIMSNYGYRTQAKRSTDKDYATIIPADQTSGVQYVDNRGRTAKLECATNAKFRFSTTEATRFISDYVMASKTDDTFSHFVLLGIDKVIDPADIANFCDKEYTINGDAGTMKFKDIYNSKFVRLADLPDLIGRPKEFQFPCE